MDHLSLSPETVDFVTTVFEMHRLTLNTETVLLQRLVAARTSRIPHSARTADPEAWQALFDDNLWLVCRMAVKHVGHGLEIEDLIQEGCLGLIAGLEHYQPGKVARLVHYLPSWVFQSITRAVADRGKLIRLPVHVYDEAYAKVSAAVDSYMHKWGTQPTPAQCAAEVGLPKEAVERVFIYLKNPVSLDALPLAQRDILMRRSLRPANDDGIPVDVDSRCLSDAVKRVMSQLSTKEREVLSRRFGLPGGMQQTLEEVGHQLGVTRERARQIEDNALKKLRHPTRSRLVRDWYPQDLAKWHDKGDRPADGRRKRSKWVSSPCQGKW